MGKSKDNSSCTTIVDVEYFEIVNVGKSIYKVVDDPIKSGDFIFNVPVGEIDLCIKAFDDGDLCVQIISGSSKGMKAILHKSWFRKAIKQ